MHVINATRLFSFYCQFEEKVPSKAKACSMSLLVDMPSTGSNIGEGATLVDDESAIAHLALPEKMYCHWVIGSLAHCMLTAFMGDVLFSSAITMHLLRLSASAGSANPTPDQCKMTDISIL
eukprot:scaffold101784_cov38-Prasinocladus_malaysianus.AAC.2